MFRAPSAALFFPPLVDDLPVLQRLYNGFQLTPEEKKDLFDLWLDCIVRHPRAWLRHRASAFRQVIGLNAQDLWSPVFMNPNGGQERVTRYYGKNPPLNRFQIALKGRFEALSKHLIYRPWVYLLLTIAIIAFGLFFWNQARAEVFFVALSGLAYEGVLFFVGPSADYRYSHYMIYSSVLATLLLIRASTRRAPDKS
jgi:hypothetical protein